MKIDDEDTIFVAPPALDTHTVEFPFYGIQNIRNARRLLIGLSANGRNVNLQLNLTEASLNSVIGGCAAAEDEMMAQKAEDQKEASEGPSVHHQSTSGSTTQTATLNVRSNGYPGGFQWAHYWLLREELGTSLLKQGYSIEGNRGRGAIEKLRNMCRDDPPLYNSGLCYSMMTVLGFGAIAKTDADRNGNATLPPVPSGTYYIVILANGTLYLH